MDERATELGVLGERIVYPGHPVVLAFLVVKRYASIDEATALSSKSSQPRVIDDLEVYGSAGFLTEALRLLEDVRDGRSPIQAIEDAEARWVSTRADGHEGSVERGAAQSRKVRDLLAAELPAWVLDSTDTPAPKEAP